MMTTLVDSQDQESKPHQRRKWRCANAAAAARDEGGFQKACPRQKKTGKG
jgi:hypothetical protein